MKPPKKILRDPPSDDRPGNRVGKPAIGLYPDVSRVKLAAAVGKSVSTVSAILTGRHSPPLSVAVAMAKAIGVSLTRLSTDLERARQEWRGRSEHGV